MIFFNREFKLHQWEIFFTVAEVVGQQLQKDWNQQLKEWSEIEERNILYE